MNPTIAKFRNVLRLPILLALPVALVACGGGGTGSNPSGTSTGAATIDVSLTAAPKFPTGTTFAISTASPVGIAAPTTTPSFDNVWVTVTKLALIPAAGPEFPDQNGELEEINDPSEEGNGGVGGFVTIVLSSPELINLLHPPSGNEQVTKLVNKFPNVPPGEYSKIRVYYENVVGDKTGGGTVLFHQTAHYHFDVHFVGGNLVVPVETDPSNGIRFFSLNINVVGLKIQGAGQSGNFLMRPQVFATVGIPEYIVSGEAQNVNPADNTFDIITGGETIHAAYRGDTIWRYIDNTVQNTIPPNTVPPSAWSSVGNFLGAKGLEDTAIVDVIGTFSPAKILLADKVDVTFPASLFGKVNGGWNPADNTFMLRLPSDNTVIPMPSRTTAYYDNAAASYVQLLNGDLSIVDNVSVTARGYAVEGVGIRAFWISIGSIGP